MSDARNYVKKRWKLSGSYRKNVFNERWNAPEHPLRKRYHIDSNIILTVVDWQTTGVSNSTTTKEEEKGRGYEKER